MGWRTYGGVAPNAVDTAALEDGAVTRPKIGDGAVGAAQIGVLDDWLTTKPPNFSTPVLVVEDAIGNPVGGLTPSSLQVISPTNGSKHGTVQVYDGGKLTLQGTNGVSLVGPVDIDGAQLDRQYTVRREPGMVVMNGVPPQQVPLSIITVQRSGTQNPALEQISIVNTGKYRITTKIFAQFYGATTGQVTVYPSINGGTLWADEGQARYFAPDKAWTGDTTVFNPGTGNTVESTIYVDLTTGDNVTAWAISDADTTSEVYVDLTVEQLT